MKFSDAKVGLKVAYGYERGAITEVLKTKIKIAFIGKGEKYFTKAQCAELQNLDYIKWMAYCPAQSECEPDQCNP
jgi:hypothetical protein